MIIAVEAFMLTVHNRLYDLYIATYGDGHIGSYPAEKQRAMAERPLSWWADLDEGHKTRAMEFSFIRYGDEAKKRVMG